MIQSEIDKLLPKIPAIIKAVLSAKNRERIEELIDKGVEMKEEFEAFAKDIFADAEICAQLVLEILQSPLAEAGIDLTIKSRDIKKAEIETLLKVEISKVIG